MSGALVQARHALKQNRKLFILESCFQNPSVRWPETFAKQGAIRVADYEDVRRHFADAR
jgi:DNA processing protein